MYLLTLFLSGTVTVGYFARFSVSALVTLLLLSLCYTVFPPASKINLASAASSLPVSEKEYANGTIIPENSPLLIWYDWVNVSGTQVVNYAMYTTPDYNYPVPRANMIGQHFLLADGTQVFIASALSELEVYRDINSDGIPQANFTSGESEILYYMYTNMSDSYTMTPIQKITQDSIPHYQWSFTYKNAHAYLQNATARIGVVASLLFSHITLSYDFSVKGNVSNLKTNFDIGKVTSLDTLDSSQFSLDGLSIALQYATATYTSKQYLTYVNGNLFNSTTTKESAIEAEIAQVEVSGIKAYDFVFGGNYTVKRGESNETHPAITETYEAKAEAASFSSISIKIYAPTIKGMSFFRDQLNLTDLFGGTWPDFNMNYETSSLIYRICFPVWDGLQIQHDPVYVGYILSNAETSPVNSEPLPTSWIIAAAVSVGVISVGLIVYFKKRK